MFNFKIDISWKPEESGPKSLNIWNQHIKVRYTCEFGGNRGLPQILHFYPGVRKTRVLSWIDWLWIVFVWYSIKYIDSMQGSAFNFICVPNFKLYHRYPTNQSEAVAKSRWIHTNCPNILLSVDSGKRNGMNRYTKCREIQPRWSSFIFWKKTSKIAKFEFICN